MNLLGLKERKKELNELQAGKKVSVFQAVEFRMKTRNFLQMVVKQPLLKSRRRIQCIKYDKNTNSANLSKYSLLKELYSAKTALTVSPKLGHCE